MAWALGYQDREKIGFDGYDWLLVIGYCVTFFLDLYS